MRSAIPVLSVLSRPSVLSLLSVVSVRWTLGAAAAEPARVDAGAPRIIELTAGRISILSRVPLRRAQTLVVRSPSGEDCGLLILDTVEARADGWLGVGAQRSETQARLDDAVLPVGESSLPDGPPCTSRRAPTRAPTWTGVHRGYVRVRPYVGFHRVGWGEHAEPTGGVIADFGAEANTASRFRIGVEIAPQCLQGQRCAREDAVFERNGVGCNELRVFVGIDPTLCLAGSNLGEESRWQWVCRDELQRKNRHLANATHYLRNVPTSRDRILGRAHSAHDGAGVVEGEGHRDSCGVRERTQSASRAQSADTRASSVGWCLRWDVRAAGESTRSA